MSKRLVVKNTTYLDVNSMETKENQTIVIEGNRFSWIGNESEFEKVENDHVIEGEGKFVIPGLMDMHVHLNYEHNDFNKMGQNLLRRKSDYAKLIAVKHVRQYLKIGVTTVRGCGGDKSLASLRQLVDEGKLIGPRMKLALNTLVQPGNQELFGTDAMIEDQKNKTAISGRDGVMHAIRDRRSEGSDHVKITTTGGVLHGKTSDVNLVLWSDDELDAMVTEAERLGMYIAAHAHATAGILAAVRNGVRTIEHSTILDEATIKMMLEKGTFITPTLSAGTFIFNMDDKRKDALPPEIKTKWEHVSSNMIRSHKMAFEKGVPLTLGTDAPVAGEHAHTNFEMKLMSDNLGMTPYQVIRSGSIISATAMKMDKELGSIETGKLADFVILSQNPKDDINVFMEVENFEKVIKDGKIVSERGKLIQN